MNYLLYLAGCVFVFVGIVAAAVARGGIHEATAAILVCGGVLIISAGAIIGVLKSLRDDALAFFAATRRDGEPTKTVPLPNE